ncbi:MAG: protein translocase subunit SecF [Candidatus Levybacteria bacterium]|nr:protein translocase subunit SecF [Candidatus Levybacteria bacterium]
MNIIGKKNLYFIFSLVVIIPGLVSLILWGLPASIDFTGGSRLTLSFPKNVDQKTTNEIKSVFAAEKIDVSTIQTSGKQVFIRTGVLDQKKDTRVMEFLKRKVGNFKQEEFEIIGPVIGGETTANAIKAVILACILIVVYVVFAFRKVPKPASSVRFGICAVVALIHDILVVVGLFSILGHFFKVEIDSLFITALLTVLGFSVHDTIVVFDRIRENLRRMAGAPFATIVNDSILQTIGRSLNTSLTVLLVLFAMLLFGGESIKWFVVALLVGIASGTYSSIFNAAPLLVVWDEWSRKRGKTT